MCYLEGLCNYCYAHAPEYLPMSTFLYAQRCFMRHLCQCICQGSAFPCILLCSFLRLCQFMLWASINKPVLLAVFCCPHVRGSLLFIVGQFYIQVWFLGCSPPLPSLVSTLYIILVWLAFCRCLRRHVRVRVRDRKVFSKINATLSYNFCKLLIKLFFSPLRLVHLRSWEL